MESVGIISKLDKKTKTSQFNSFVLLKKPNGFLRVCLDPTNLNKYIVHPVCNMCTLDEINHLLKNAKFFSVFDTTKGFFQVPLDADSCLLTAMFTPFGIYIFNIMTMCLSNEDAYGSGDLFESSLHICISDLPDCNNFADNTLIFDRAQEEHHSIVIKFMENCLDMNIETQSRRGSDWWSRGALLW